MPSRSGCRRKSRYIRQLFGIQPELSKAIRCSQHAFKVRSSPDSSNISTVAVAAAATSRNDEHVTVGIDYCHCQDLIQLSQSSRLSTISFLPRLEATLRKPYAKASSATHQLALHKRRPSNRRSFGSIPQRATHPKATSLCEGPRRLYSQLEAIAYYPCDSSISVTLD